MWGFSFDDLARRAQEEAAKLAEQAQDAAANMQSPALFNLDSMNPESAQQKQTTPLQNDYPSSTAMQPSSLFNTPLFNTSANVCDASSLSDTEGNTDHVPSLISDVPSPRASLITKKDVRTGTEKKKTPTAIKISTVNNGDSFFDSWGVEDGTALSSVPDSSNSADQNANQTKEIEFQSIKTEENVQQIESESNAWDDDLNLADDNDSTIDENLPDALNNVSPDEEIRTPPKKRVQELEFKQVEIGRGVDVLGKNLDAIASDHIEIDEIQTKQYQKEQIPHRSYEQVKETELDGNTRNDSDHVPTPNETQSTSLHIKELHIMPSVESNLREPSLDAETANTRDENDFDIGKEGDSPAYEATNKKEHAHTEAHADPIDITFDDEHQIGTDKQEVVPGAVDNIYTVDLIDAPIEEMTSERVIATDTAVAINVPVNKSKVEMMIPEEVEPRANNDVNTIDNEKHGSPIVITGADDEMSVIHNIESNTADNIIVEHECSDDPRVDDGIDVAASKSNEAVDHTTPLPESDNDLHKERYSRDSLAADQSAIAEFEPETSIERSEENILLQNNYTSEKENSITVEHSQPDGNNVKTISSNQPAHDQISTDKSNLDRTLSKNASTEHESSPYHAAAKPALLIGAPATKTTAKSLQSVFESHTSNLFESSKLGWSFQNKNQMNNEVDSYCISSDFPSLIAQAEPSSGENLINQVDVIDNYNDSAFGDTYNNGDRGDGNVEEANTSYSKPVNSTDSRVSFEGISEHLAQKFVKQLERMTESHQLEMDELHRTYKLEINHLQSELQEERTEKKKTKARDKVAAQDKHLSQMRDLEKSYNKQLEEKDKELVQMMKRNEGFTLKIDSMKREIDGLLKLVDERTDEISKLKSGHGSTMLKVEDSIKNRQEELSKKDVEIRDLKAGANIHVSILLVMLVSHNVFAFAIQSSISSLKTELDSTTANYNTLKTRAKAVATELKDRRIEVRTLSNQNEQMITINAASETKLANLESQNDQQRRTIDYKNKDIELLNEKIRALNKELDTKDNLLLDSSSIGEKAISSYKRKAQEALAAANSRLAAANQAREEAEAECKAANTASDDALERARVSEVKKLEAERIANEATALLETEKNSKAQLVLDLQQTRDNMKDTIESMQIEVADAQSSKEYLQSDIDQIKTHLNEQKELNSELRHELLEAKNLCTSLQEEVHNLRDEAQRSSAAVVKWQEDEGLNVKHEKKEIKVDSNLLESDGTIIMLQQELQGANDAISELKLALRMALLENAESSPTEAQLDDASVSMDRDHYHTNSSDGNNNTPLFFAIEKQNELNTARDEINRLANMLCDVESEKQEAFDAMEQMRQKMESANARLQRYEKLGMTSNRPPHNSVLSMGYSSHRDIDYSSSSGSHHNTDSPENDSAVNLEYLKNVMLSYLNAKTLAERRKLVPVVATVLCLTPEEHSKAVQSVEESSGLTGVASSLWENLESKAQSMM